VILTKDKGGFKKPNRGNGDQVRGFKKKGGVARPEERGGAGKGRD